MSDLFDNIKPGHTVHYLTPQGQTRKGRVVMNKGTHLVLNAGGRYGTPQVVTQRNFVKAQDGTRVTSALLSNVAKSLKKEDYMNTEPHKWNYPDKPEGVLKLDKGQKAAMRKSVKDHDARLKKLYGKRSVKEDSHDAEGAAERVAKTKKHKKLHEVSTGKLVKYVSRAIADRKKAGHEFQIASKDRYEEPLKAHADSEGSKHGGWSGMNEVSAPGKEEWIKANKQRFIDRYGKEKGLRVLYAKAWKDSKNESVNEEIKRYTTHHDDYMVTSTTGPAGHSISVRHGGTLIAQRLGGKLITNSKSGKKDTKLHDVIKAHTDHPEVQKFLKTNEARESEWAANRALAGQSSKPEKGHYLMRDGRRLSGPHSPEDAVKEYKKMNDSKGVKIVHVKETHQFDVTHELISEDKVKKAAKLAVNLKKKATSNKHVETKPTLETPRSAVSTAITDHGSEDQNVSKI